MCKIINDLVENGRNEGFAQGEAKATLNSIKTLKTTQNWTTEQALAALNIDKNNWPTYIALL